MSQIGVKFKLQGEQLRHMVKAWAPELAVEIMLIVGKSLLLEEKLMLMDIAVSEQD